ncbi:MAG: hypothetical protein M1819_007096 [Sarea resinae]|nr:MAG: hypothetical protein M1819_007096 [Sarea resinae]
MQSLAPSAAPTSPVITSDEFYSSPDSKRDSERQYHIFFITGNPGLISYYHTFLACLSNSLRSPSALFHVFGVSLKGFLENNVTRPSTQQKDGAVGTGPPYSLEDQIEYVEGRLWRYARERGQHEIEKSPSDGNVKQCRVKIILMGHSVGSYILLELLRRHRLPASQANNGHLDIVGGILLFPTVTHIAKSPSGQKFTALSKIPNFAAIVGMLARVLTAVIPSGFLHHLIKLITRFPDEAAKTTAEFLQSRTGVQQALCMAQDEMTTITEDCWDDEVWGAASDRSKGANLSYPKLIFYFGQNDNWVADHTRDDLIAARGDSPDQNEGWRPRMMIDETGIPHGFSIRHSAPVAEKTSEFIMEIVGAFEGKEAQSSLASSTEQHLP